MAPYGGPSGGGNGFGGGDGDNVIRMGRKFGRSLRGNVTKVVLIALVVIAGISSYYQIEPEEVGLVMRFGDYIRKSEPGPHFKLPFGIEQVIHVPVQRQLKAEFGFRTQQADVRTEYAPPEQTQHEARMLTGDLNVADVEWVVQYKIQDPYKFIFNVRDVTSTLRDMSEAAMRQVVGDHSVTEVLTFGREAIQVKAKQALQDIADHYGTGIQVVQLVLQDVNPPEPVRESFNEVNQAMQERERTINEAWARYNTVIPEARGKAQENIQTAQGYATARVNRAQGNVQRFLALEKEYSKAPDVTRTRLYLETLSDVLPKARRRIFLDQELKGLLPLLPLGEGAKK